MEPWNLAGVVIAVVGLPFVANLRGCSAGLAEFFRKLKGDGPSFFFGTTPTTKLGWRLFGVLIVVFGAFVAISPPPS